MAVILINDTLHGAGLAAPKRQVAVIAAAAAKITPQETNQIIRLGAGIVYATLRPQLAEHFRLHSMTAMRAAYARPTSADLISVEARHGVHSGISAADRATTLSVLADPRSTVIDLVSPGHIFPVLVSDGGVLVEQDLKNGVADYFRLSSLDRSAVACYADLLDADGEFLSADEAVQLAAREKLNVVCLSAVIKERLTKERIVYKVAEAKLPTQKAGDLKIAVYESEMFPGEHVALIKGEISSDKIIPTRVQVEFAWADIFGGNNPPTRELIHRALNIIGDKECGIFLYLRRPNISELGNQVADPVAAEQRQAQLGEQQYGIGAQILYDLGVRKIELLTRSNRDFSGTTHFGIDIVRVQKI